MTEVPKPVTDIRYKSDVDAERCVQTLRQLLADAESGDVVAILCTVKRKNEYDYIRVGFSYEECAGILARSQHKLMRAWDDE